MNWQPMETAPKDGSDVLVWARSVAGDAISGYYHVVSFDGDGWLVVGEYTVAATYWMPLPQPPITEDVQP